MAWMGMFGEPGRLRNDLEEPNQFVFFTSDMRQLQATLEFWQEHIHHHQLRS